MSRPGFSIPRPSSASIKRPESLDEVISRRVNRPSTAPLRRPVDQRTEHEKKSVIAWSNSTAIPRRSHRATDDSLASEWWKRDNCIDEYFEMDLTLAERNGNILSRADASVKTVFAKKDESVASTKSKEEAEAVDAGLFDSEYAKLLELIQNDRREMGADIVVRKIEDIEEEVVDTGHQAFRHRTVAALDSRLADFREYPSLQKDLAKKVDKMKRKEKLKKQNEISYRPGGVNVVKYHVQQARLLTKDARAEEMRRKAEIHQQKLLRAKEHSKQLQRAREERADKFEDFRMERRQHHAKLFRELQQVPWIRVAAISARFQLLSNVLAHMRYINATRLWLDRPIAIVREVLKSSYTKFVMHRGVDALRKMKGLLFRYAMRIRYRRKTRSQPHLVEFLRAYKKARTTTLAVRHFKISVVKIKSFLRRKVWMGHVDRFSLARQWDAQSQRYIAICTNKAEQASRAQLAQESAVNALQMAANQHIKTKNEARKAKNRKTEALPFEAVKAKKTKAIASTIGATKTVKGAIPLLQPLKPLSRGTQLPGTTPAAPAALVMRARAKGIFTAGPEDLAPPGPVRARAKGIFTAAGEGEQGLLSDKLTAKPKALGNLASRRNNSILSAVVSGAPALPSNGSPSPVLPASSISSKLKRRAKKVKEKFLVNGSEYIPSVNDLMAIKDLVLRVLYRDRRLIFGEKIKKWEESVADFKLFNKTEIQQRQRELSKQRGGLAVTDDEVVNLYFKRWKPVKPVFTVTASPEEWERAFDGVVQSDAGRELIEHARVG